MHDLVLERGNLVSHTANRYFYAFRKSLNSLEALLRLYFGISGPPGEFRVKSYAY